MKTTCLGTFGLRLAGVAALAALAAGCSTNVSMSPHLPKANHASTDAKPVSATIAPVTTIDHGDLENGSARHVLASGTVVLDYWTVDQPKPWTRASRVPINLQLTLRKSDRSHKVIVTRMLVTSVQGDQAPVTQIDDRGSFVVTPPYSYQSVFTLPTQQTSAPLTLTVQADLLVQTTPTSHDYARKSVSDTLRLTFAKDAS